MDKVADFFLFPFHVLTFKVNHQWDLHYYEAVENCSELLQYQSHKPSVYKSKHSPCKIFSFGLLISIYKSSHVFILNYFVQRYVEAQCCIASNDYKGKRNISSVWGLVPFVSVCMKNGEYLPSRVLWNDMLKVKYICIRNLICCVSALAIYITFSFTSSKEMVKGDLV